MQKQKLKSKRCISEETKKSIASYTQDLISKGEYKRLEDIARKFYTSAETVRKVLISYSIIIPTAKSIAPIDNTVEEEKMDEQHIIITEEENTTIEETTTEDQIDDVAEAPEEENIVENTDSDLTEVTVCKVIKAITCSNRHSQPYNAKQIFQHEIGSEEMFDFPKLEETAIKFIEDNVTFVNGVAIDSIECIVTGLTMLATAVIVACQKRNVNLTLLHYDIDEKIYRKQIISETNNAVKASPILNTLAENKELGKVYVFKGTDLFNIKEKFWLIRKSEFTILNSAQPVQSDFYITDSYEDGWELFSKILKDSRDETKECKITVTYAECKMNEQNSKFYFDKNSQIYHTYTHLNNK